jgi:diguanylate cyclase (GGDEF)-like protein
VFNEVDEYDSCPHLRGRALDGGTAVCVPLKVMGQSIGISHSIAASTPRQEHIDKVAEVVQVGGDRLGVLRAFATTNRKASRDRLTGLLNRRIMEEEVAELDLAGRRYSVAFCDLDHFKNLNDTHGHATGDRALRLFSETLTNSMRPTDLTARWGGEEFVVVLPDTELQDAADIIDRLRELLSRALMNATLPRFTFSAGVAESDLSFDHTTAAADAALLEAKRDGRDRVVIASAGAEIASETSDPLDDAPATNGTGHHQPAPVMTDS